MRRVAVIGSGIVGLQVAHGLRQAGWGVTLFSDRTPQAWLDQSKPTGAAARYPMALEYERSLGLAHWEAVAPRGEGAYLTLCPRARLRAIRLLARFPAPFQAVDVRLQSHRWMHDLVERGGELVIESVTVERLDEIARAHDLTVVAAGRGALCQLFQRDAARSVHSQPHRQVAMVITRGAPMAFPGVPFVPLRMNFVLPAGELSWAPYFHKDAGTTWSLVVDARPGGSFDRFRAARSGAEALTIAKAVIREHCPWDYPWARDMQLADEHGWLVGAITPTVRHPVARLLSGRVVTGVGDTLMSMDPLTGHGANNGSRMARHLVERAVAHGDAAFDEPWMVETFDTFFDDYGGITYEFSNLLLGSLPRSAVELLLAQHGSTGVGNGARQRLADALVANISDPRRYTRAIQDGRAARSLIAEMTGQPAHRMIVAGGLAVLRDLLLGANR